MKLALRLIKINYKQLEVCIDERKKICDETNNVIDQMKKLQTH
jgi:hypothetical protein